MRINENDAVNVAGRPPKKTPAAKKLNHLVRTQQGMQREGPPERI